MCQKTQRREDTMLIRISDGWRLKNQMNLFCISFSHQVIGANLQVKMTFAGISLHPVWGSFAYQLIALLVRNGFASPIRDII